MINTGNLWEVLKNSDDVGYLINASTFGEDRWSETEIPEGGGLVPGHVNSLLYQLIINKLLYNQGIFCIVSKRSF